MIQILHRVGCSGICGRWLLVMEGGHRTTVEYPDNATAFPTLPAAVAAAKAAGWHGENMIHPVCPNCHNRMACRCRSRTKAHRTDCPSYREEITS